MIEKREPRRSRGGGWRDHTAPRRSGLPLALAILAVILLLILGALVAAGATR